MAQMLDAVRLHPNPWTDASIQAIVRVHTEPCTYVQDWVVHEQLTRDPERYLAHLRLRLSEIAAGERPLEQPPKRIFTDQQGDFRVMPCVTGEGAGAVKTVKIVGTNLVQRVVPDQITVGKALRLHPHENFVTHVFDACLLSSARTGACATIALRLLAPTARKIGILGAGRVAFYASLYIAATISDVELVVYDEQACRASALAQTLIQGGVNCHSGSHDDALRGDVVVSATSSRVPVVAPADTRAACVISVGADAENQHELTPEWLQVAQLFMDSPDALEVGDLLSWSEAGLLRARPEALLDLFRARKPSTRARQVFVSGGSALFDNLTIEYLLLDGDL